MKKLEYLRILLIVIAIATTTIACSNDSEDDLVDAIDNDGDDDPDTDKATTYDANVQSIIQSACIGCHASPPVNGAPFSLVNFSDVNARSGGILSRMSLQNGAAGAMPPSGRLPQSTIDVIKKWINDGKLEN